MSLAAITLFMLGAGCSSAPAATNTRQEQAPSNNASEPVRPSTDHDMDDMDTTNTATRTTNTPTTPTTVQVTPTSSSTSTVKTPTPPATPAANGPKTYSMADVKAANTPAKCWTAINGKVYDVTAWEKKHPGGEPAILKLCGIDGSSLFNGKHGGQPQPAQALAGFEIGVLK